MISQLTCSPLTHWNLQASGETVPADIAGRTVPAHVPGTSHTALLDADLIQDPYVGDGEVQLAWMHRAHWRYASPLTLAAAAPDERVDLVFGGIDTLATVTLGDRELGRTANMHRSYRFDVRELADGAARDLAVDIASALDAGHAEERRIGARPAAYDRPFNMVRKMACSFGWDWGPDLQTAGLWKPVQIERWRVARLDSVRPLVSVDEHGTAHVTVHVDVERSGLTNSDADLTVQAVLGGPSGEVRASATVPAGSSAATVELTVENPVLWWPVGYGEAVLHDLAVTVAAADGASNTAPDAALDTWNRRIGLRTVTIDTTPDEHGTPFTIVVNGRPVFIRGANWIPDDHLLTRITRERLAERVDQALGANLNLLRIWGGGIYETDDFYDVCDERGVLVWQDFLLACAAYPEEDPHYAEFEAEARENVVRLMSHPSLVIWNGGNENLWGYMDWEWQDALEGRSWGYRYYTELFPSVLAELDPSRPYSEGSPYSPGSAPWERHPNDPDHGTHHQWEVWNRIDYSEYRSEVPRFCSEFGFQGPPTWATLERAVQPANGVWDKRDPVWLLHQKAEDGNDKLDRGMLPHLGMPDDFDAWAWAAQLNQARAIAYGIEHYRSWWPRTAGSIVWQLNDCWPVTSWAAVDGDGREKPLWFALRRASAEHLVAVVERDGELRVALVNDSDEAWSGELVAQRTTLDGDAIAASRTAAHVPPRSVELVSLEAAAAVETDAAREVLTLELGDVRTVHPFVEDVELDLAPSAISAQVREVPDGFEVEVTASSLARAVTLQVDRVWPSARVDDGVVDLAAGWSHVFHVSFVGDVPDGARTRADELVAAHVLRTANELVQAPVASLG